ncbi:cytochrome c oxidase assembly protein subunit 15 [Faunimonas pinastri]|uniref:Heme A synthase n=1 Tax=Faunimonas pinastri TaxID=1855383 RepID=A0A1H9CBH2_9HYPH|nr:COX15/CtaA family protein [Faunimonas pinastri]SEP98337.1 cytochrome c oxidase assembly protein subunit 15 [Faunimonas pinastri]
MSVTTLDRSPRAANTARRRSLRPLRAWLAVIAVLVFAMVLVGGATRLTGSGLSITQWNPISGAIPPLTDQAWQAEFANYQQSSQYEILNEGMTLSQFKGIFWWEWSHRQLGRFIGLVFLAGIVWFAVMRTMTRRIAIGLVGLLFLLGTQGLVGWIMVASGLKPGMTAVEPVKLALHLTLACMFFSAVVAMFVRLGPNRQPVSSGMRWGARLLVAMVFVQIALGALVAGHHAGLTYNTWPLMDGHLVPAGMGMMRPFWMNFVDNIPTIQFDHRVWAYAVLVAVIIHAGALWRQGEADGRRRAALMVAVVFLQVALGIATLLLVVPVHLALTHQAVALLLLTTVVWNAGALRTQGIRVPLQRA